jgi:CDP-4-dehydro-6-deoxyglucose reductase
MQYNIEIQPAGVSYKSENNLLSDALEQSIPLEHSCKTGDCGVCAAEVKSGIVENENGDVVTSGSVLTCQSKAKSDVVLGGHYYPELVNIKSQSLPCKTASIRFPNEDVIVLTFRFPPTAKFDYLAGQYVDLNYKGVTRSYSIANAKSDTKEVELHIRRVENGKMSALLFDSQLKTNQLMRLQGPKGTFFVRDGEKELVFVATGTGIAPVKAMVEDLINKGDRRKVHVYWGMRHEQDAYNEDIEQLSQEHEHIQYSLVLSREDSASRTVQAGYVQDAVCKDFDSLEFVDVYACGSLSMINSTRNVLIEKGLLEDAFFSDAFTPAK